MNKTMKYKPLLLSFLTIITLMLVSCEKNKSIMEYVSGDDKDKIELKGSMMSWSRKSFMSISTRRWKTAP